MSDWTLDESLSPRNMDAKAAGGVAAKMELARPESGGMAGESRPAGSGEAVEAHFSAEEALDATSQLLESGACPATRDRVVIDRCGLELRLSENSRAALHSY